MCAEKERKAAEIQVMKENPLSPLVGGQHFEKMNKQQAWDIKEMMNEPTSIAIEYFMQKALEEESKCNLTLKVSNENPPEASVTTMHFYVMKEKKARETKEAWEKTHQKMMAQEARLSVD